MRTGYYISSGNIRDRILVGGWWANARVSNKLSNYLYTFSLNVHPYDNNYRGYGFAIRCTIRVE